jgi:hypothetical protein
VLFVLFRKVPRIFAGIARPPFGFFGSHDHRLLIRAACNNL